MRRFLLLLALLAGPVAAQTPARPLLPAAIPLAAARPTAADTVQALHRLFVRHRRRGGLVVGGAVVADLAMAGVLAANEPKGEPTGGGGIGGGLSNFGFDGYALLTTLLASPAIIFGLGDLIAHSSHREARLVATYEATHHLPAHVGRKLRRHLR